MTAINTTNDCEIIETSDMLANTFREFYREGRDIILENGVRLTPWPEAGIYRDEDGGEWIETMIEIVEESAAFWSGEPQYMIDGLPFVRRYERYNYTERREAYLRANAA